MTQEEFDYFGTTNLTFEQARILDAMRSEARYGKGKAPLSSDSELPAWTFKTKKPSDVFPTELPSSSREVTMVADIEPEILEESVELERQRRKRIERELQEDLARIREAEEEAQSKELWDKCEEGSEQIRRERERRQQTQVSF